MVMDLKIEHRLPTDLERLRWDLRESVFVAHEFRRASAYKLGETWYFRVLNSDVTAEQEERASKDEAVGAAVNYVLKGVLEWG